MLKATRTSVERQLVEKIELTGPEVERLFTGRLQDLTAGHWVEGNQLRVESYTSHRFDHEVTREELGKDYDLVFAACQFAQTLERYKRDQQAAEMEVPSVKSRNREFHELAGRVLRKASMNVHENGDNAVAELLLNFNDGATLHIRADHGVIVRLMK